jgi:hypothetical protein
MGGVWPRRPGPSGVLFAPPDPAAGGTFLLLLFSGILSGGTSRVSCTGSTMAVRPLAPRQPGRDEVNAPAAGSVLLSLAAAAFFAILLMRSPKDGGTAAGILCGPVCPCGAIPSPCANSAGLTCDGRPRVLLVCSPVSGSHRGASRGCGFRGCCGAGPRWVGFGSRVASDCLRRSRRIMGIFVVPRFCDGLWAPGRGSGTYGRPDLSLLGMSVFGIPAWRYASPSSSSIGETSPGRKRSTCSVSGSGELGGEISSAPPYR